MREHLREHYATLHGRSRFERERDSRLPERAAQPAQHVPRRGRLAPAVDRYVLEELRARNWVLGGEQSGHIIEMGFNRTGDGIASALLTMEALAGGDLSERHAMAKLPQRLVNVRVRDRDAFAQADDVKQAIADADQALSGRGRVLVRPSGTEPLVRVMVEAPTEAEERLRGRGRVLIRPSGTEPLVRVMVEAPSDDEAEEVCVMLVGVVEAELGA